MITSQTNQWNERKEPMLFNRTKDYRRIAIGKVYDAVKNGVLIRPSCCDRCRKECKPDGHHKDYSKPLDVDWLCRSCHKLWHGNNGDGLNANELVETVEAEWMTPSDLSKLICMAPSTLSRWRSEGYGPEWKRLGMKFVRYNVADVRRWIDAQ